MKFVPAMMALFAVGAAATAQAAPVDVQFKLVAMKDNYDAEPAPVAGATVRFVLGEVPDWQGAAAGRKFVTDAKGQARFTLDVPVDSRIRSRNIGFTPFSAPSRAEHLKIAVELDHPFPADGNGPARSFRWLLTMDLDCFANGECRTDGFMNIYTPDAQGRFSRQLVREGSGEAWKVPELGNQVMRGMRYQVADFLMTPDEKDPQRRTLQFAVKRLPR